MNLRLSRWFRTSLAQISRVLATVALALFCSAVSAAGIRFHAEFDLRLSGIVIARTTWSVEQDSDGAVIFLSQTQPSVLFSVFDKGEIIERSEWTLESDWLRPQFYSYSRTGRKQRQVEIRFDWKLGVAHHNVQGRQWKLKVPVGTLDKLNYLIAAMADLERGKRVFNYWIADGGGLKQYQLYDLGEERIDTALGIMNTVILQRKRNNSPRETIIWCAPKLRFLPVRVLHREKDNRTIELVLRSVNML